jgi:hypothetical protein
MKPHNTGQLPVFTEAAVIFIVFSVLAVWAVPRFGQVYAANNEILPLLTLLIFRFSPKGLMAIALLLGIGASLGRLRSDWRWISRLSFWLSVVFGAMLVLGLAAPAILK